MDKLHIIIPTALTILSILYAIFCGIKAKFKRKDKNSLEKTTSDTNETCSDSNEESKSFMELFVSKLLEITGYMSGTEKFYKSITSSKVGDTKKNDVLQKLKVDCLTNGESFDTENCSKAIEILCDFSKQVNSSEENKIKNKIENKNSSMNEQISLSKGQII